MLRTNLKPLLIGAAVGLVLGLLLGMLLFWQVWPVKWTDANTYDLSPAAKSAYVQLLADAARADRDYARAAKLLEDWYPEEKQQAFADAAKAYKDAGRTDKAQDVEDLGLILQVPTATLPAPEAPAGLIDRLREPCLVFVLVLLALVLAAAGWRILSRRRNARAQGPSEEPYRPVRSKAEDGDAAETGTAAATRHWITTYRAGESAYDESFPIEAESGEYLGECGVGISEMLGTPDRVTAFELWLFDKSDIRTVTKVLLSEHAYGDETLRTKLAAKGEIMLAKAGAPIVLDTTNMQVRAQITELTYDEEDELPKGVIARLTIEINLETKQEADESEVVK